MHADADLLLSCFSSDSESLDTRLGATVEALSQTEPD